MTNPTQATLELLNNILDEWRSHGIIHARIMLEAAFAEREARLVAEMAVVQQSHKWLYNEVHRLENALKDIASRAHANLATREPEDRTNG